MNISLIGMMGCGKTTIGKCLSTALKGFAFIDTDSLIEENEGMRVCDIFTQKGEDYFRALETKVLKEIFETKGNKIISTGGGMVKSAENRQLLKENSTIVYLKTDAKEIYNRLKNNTERPLLRAADMEDRINNLLNERSRLYEEAHIIIDTSGKNIDIIQEETVQKILEYGKN